jgi:hypothetical protein
MAFRRPPSFVKVLRELCGPQNSTVSEVVGETNAGASGGEADVRVVFPEPVSATTIVTPNCSTQYKSSSPERIVRTRFKRRVEGEKKSTSCKYFSSLRLTVLEDGESLSLGLQTKLTDVNRCRG